MKGFNLPSSFNTWTPYRQTVSYCGFNLNYMMMGICGQTDALNMPCSCHITTRKLCYKTYYKGMPRESGTRHKTNQTLALSSRYWIPSACSPQVDFVSPFIAIQGREKRREKRYSCLFTSSHTSGTFRNGIWAGHACVSQCFLENG